MLQAAIASFRAVNMDYTPQISFQDTSPKRLVAPKSETTSSDYQQACLNPSPPQSETESFSSQTTSKFPVNNLALSSQQSYGSRYNPPTPPPDGDGTDTMDWTPTQSSFQPNTSARAPRRPQTSAPQTGKSPFYGRLPPAPISQAHKMRNPPNKLAFHGTPPKEQQNFFNSVTGRSSTLDSQNNPAKPSSGYTEMAPPKFFPKSDSRTDTGLESLFAGVFTLADEPPEVCAARKEQEAQDPGYHLRGPPPEAPIWRKVSIMLLCLATLAWTSMESSLRIAVPIQVVATGIAAAVAGKNLLQAMNMHKAYWVVSDILLFGCELAASISLTSAIMSPNGGRQEGVQTLGPALLIILGLQEIWLMISAPKTGNASSVWGSVTPTPTQSSSSPLGTTGHPPPASQPNNSQQVLPSTPSLRSQSQHEARNTRSMSKAAAAVGSPSSALLGLSLGGTSDLEDGNDYGARNGGRRGYAPRNTHRAWERGPL